MITLFPPSLHPFLSSSLPPSLARSLPSSLHPSLHPSYRCDYQNTCELLVTLFDTTASSYQQTLQTNPGNDNELRIREGIYNSHSCS